MTVTHLPVSPLVAPTTVSFSGCSPGAFRAFRRSRKNSNKFPNNCKATSLNANVGPWKSSRTYLFSSSFLRGVMSGCRNVWYDFCTSLRRSTSDISSREIYRERTATERSTNEYDFHCVFQFGGRDGMVSGMYKPPFGAKPVRTVCQRSVH